MKRLSRPLWMGVLILFFLLGCNLFAAGSNGTSTPPPPTTAGSPAPTLPNGVPVGAAMDSMDGLAFYDIQGKMIFKMPFPLNEFSGPEEMHIAGRYIKGSAGVPVIFHIIDKGEFLRQEDSDGKVSDLVNATGFISLVGAPGLPVYSYSLADYQTMGKSDLYIGTLAAPPSAPVLTKDPAQDGTVLEPLGIDIQNSKPAGIWYSTTPFGIGGDIVFVVQPGLYYLDLSTVTSTEILKKDHNIAGFSPDHEWVAYTLAGSGVEPALSPLSLISLKQGTQLSFPLLPAKDGRGAGDAVFSPDDHYVAWMEGSGFQMGATANFQATIRLATTTGDVITALPMGTFEQTAVLGQIMWAAPVAWMDDQTLLIQVRGGASDQSVMLKLDVPSMSVSYFAPGSFVGFLYP